MKGLALLTTETAVSAPTEKAFLGHPRGLFLLFLVEMWERFSYYGMRGLLILYLIKETTGDNPGRGWSKLDANNLYGWYTGLVYLTPIIGGIIADRLIGTHRSMLVGGIIIAVGHLVMALSGIGDLAQNDLGMTIFVMGLVLIVIGTGHFKPSVSVMVGQLYPSGDPRRDGAFTIFYMGINVGAVLCAYTCGTIGEKYGWHLGFGLAGIGMIIGLGLYARFRSLWLGLIGAPPQDLPNRVPHVILGASIIVAVVGTLFHTGAFAWMGRTTDTLMGTGRNGLITIMVLVGLIIAWCVWFVRKQESAGRGPTAAILIFVVFNAVFWLAFEQTGSSLNIFASENTDRVVAGWEVPATWFQSANPLTIIAFGPLFAALWSGLGRRKLNPSQPMKIALALFLIGAGYLFMVGGSMQATGGAKACMFWLVATYALHTWGELCLSPTGLAFVTRAAPVRYVSFLMGIYFLSNFVAGKVGGMMAGQVEGIEQGKVELFWYPWFRLGGQADFYLLFVVLTVGAGFLILLLTPILKRMIKGVEPG